MTSDEEDEHYYLNFDTFEIENDETEDVNDEAQAGPSVPTKPMTQDEKRVRHNELERKRRDTITDSFISLRCSLPTMHPTPYGKKLSKKTESSRAQILKKAAEYIEFMTRRNSEHKQNIEDLKRHNQLLENKILYIEKLKMCSSKSKIETEICSNADAETLVVGLPGSNANAETLVVGLPGSNADAETLVVGLPGSNADAETLVVGLPCSNADAETLVVGLPCSNANAEVLVVEMDLEEN